VVTLMANALTLSPGTTALEIDPERGVWFVYVLGPRDAAGVDRARRRVLDMQRRVLAAFDRPTPPQRPQPPQSPDPLEGTP
jgi:multicomponent Na+:H+ antiporter subunit E